MNALSQNKAFEIEAIAFHCQLTWVIEGHTGELDLEVGSSNGE